MGLGSMLNKKKEESGIPASISDTMWPASYAVFLPPCLDTVIGCDLLNYQPKQVFSSLSCFVTVTRKRRSTAFKRTNTALELEEVREHIPQSLTTDLRLDLANKWFCLYSHCAVLCFLPAMALGMTLLGSASVSCWWGVRVWCALGELPVVDCDRPRCGFPWQYCSPDNIIGFQILQNTA